MSDQTQDPAAEARTPDSTKLQMKNVVDAPAPETAPEVAPAEPAEVTPEAVPQEKREASKGVREMGEDRKVLLESMLSMAESSDVSKDALFKLLEEKDSLRKAAEKKFGDRLAALRGEQATQEETKTAEQMKMEAKAELLLEMEAKERSDMVVDVAEKLSMNQDEATQLQKMTEALMTAGNLDFETALHKAAMLEKPSHASVLSMPGGATPNASATGVAVVTSEDHKVAKMIGGMTSRGRLSAQDVAEKRKANLKTLEQGGRILLGQ